MKPETRTVGKVLVALVSMVLDEEKTVEDVVTLLEGLDRETIENVTIMAVAMVAEMVVRAVSPERSFDQILAEIADKYA